MPEIRREDPISIAEPQTRCSAGLHSNPYVTSGAWGLQGPDQSFIIGRSRAETCASTSAICDVALLRHRFVEAR